MKRNCGSWVCKNHNEDFNAFKCRCQVVVVHHFDDHTHFVPVESDNGGFCRCVNSDEKRKQAHNNGKFKDKALNKALCKALSDIAALCRVEKALKEAHHPLSLQWNKAINSKVVRLVLKHLHHSKSMKFGDRVSFMVIIDSVGTEEGVSSLFGCLGVTTTSPTTAHFCHADKVANHKLQHSQKLSTKKQWSSARCTAMKLEEN